MADNDQHSSRIGRTIIGITIAFLFPLLIATGYLWVKFTYDLWQQSVLPDYFAMAISVAVGLIGVIVLPVGRVWRAVVGAAYLPVAFSTVFYWGFLFVCGAFSACP